MLLGAGGALLSAGAELFAEHVVGAARRVGLTTFGLALLLAGAGPEEALVAGLASGRDRPDLAAGDVLGANVVIATLTATSSLLGAAVLVAPSAPVCPSGRLPPSAATPGAAGACLRCGAGACAHLSTAYQCLGRLEWPQPAGLVGSNSCPVARRRVHCHSAGTGARQGAQGREHHPAAVPAASVICMRPHRFQDRARAGTGRPSGGSRHGRILMSSQQVESAVVRATRTVPAS
ncbi:MAG: hypothetical protein AVDCRST_MAG29-510 [uncultured Nocardioidaceae bacterium]|uniref:Sodium/calcium exchanger membrane region domain-containing protein n=1 Tax=uncultured Nocardioidaceae bacterium TaxID=253824 RepID=A0A6J4L8P6_9ACTN|nr:MAG: hypothetical protein AVDCRST_MAG29-510 [uncultured Nocardioidaceae bacterium]